MTAVKTFHQKAELSDEILLKLLKSEQEAEGLTMRNIRCPFCNYLVEKVFSDISGHKQIYCQKCKQEYIVNLGYFRRQRQQPYFRITFPDNGQRDR